MTKQEFIDWALSRGYTLDRWGHLGCSVRTGNDAEPMKVYRYKRQGQVQREWV